MWAGRPVETTAQVFQMNLPPTSGPGNDRWVLACAPSKPASANEYSAFLIRNAYARGDEMNEFAYAIGI
jgi:hypothetical protein